jgi:hypothetical protein
MVNSMIVKELIAELSKYDENLEVGHINWEFYPDYDTIDSVDVVSNQHRALRHSSNSDWRDPDTFIGLA